ncbi:hypothetical protein ACTFIV_004412 [Dictyostelium citrinum]
MKLLFFICLIISCYLIQYSNSENIRPVVLWHGLGDSGLDPLTMGKLKELIENQLPGVYVKNIAIGNSIAEDSFNSFFKNVNEQLEMVCKMLKEDTNLTSGFNAVGLSQGGQFLRGYVERCNDPPVYNLISLGGQHQGVSSLPRCTALNSTLCKIADDLVELGVYEKYVQDTLVPGEYWQDPFNYDEYVEKSVFLADINNVRPEKNQTYKDNLLSVNNFVLGEFLADTIVIPRESELFGYYAPGQDNVILPMEKTDLYIEDWIGIQQLDNEGRLIKISCPGNHLQFTDQWFNQNVIPYLSNQIN